MLLWTVYTFILFYYKLILFEIVLAYFRKEPSECVQPIQTVNKLIN